MDEQARTVVVFSGGGTGGHLYPALALADALVAERPDVAPYFIGSERGLEARVLPARGLEHHLVRVEGLKRSRTLENFRVLGRLRTAVVDVMSLYRTLSPSLVVLTGGFAAAPAGLAAAFRRIPMALQEQNALPGLTTRLLSRFADRIFIAFEEAAEKLPSGREGRIIHVGNPVRDLARVGREAGRAAFGLSSEGPVLLIAGGSQGSAALNKVVLELVGTAHSEDRRPHGLQVLWSTGPTHVDTVKSALQELGDPGWVTPVGYIEDIPAALAAADMAVARAGAMTTAEFLCTGLPAILVPLPTSAEDHQTWNARALESAGAAVHAPESELSGTSLLSLIHELLGDPERLERMSAQASAMSQPDAARITARHLAEMLPAPGDADR